MPILLSDISPRGLAKLYTNIQGKRDRGERLNKLEAFILNHCPNDTAFIEELVDIINHHHHPAEPGSYDEQG